MRIMNNSDSTAAGQHSPCFPTQHGGELHAESVRVCCAVGKLCVRTASVSDRGRNFPRPRSLAGATAPHSAAFHT